jgi:hypothetical protein
MSRGIGAVNLQQQVLSCRLPLHTLVSQCVKSRVLLHSPASSPVGRLVQNRTRVFDAAVLSVHALHPTCTSQA